uniref:Uncharacterized protein n=1 Tax=Cacopsylla melanoneura TaxID=428564 RepID=A0A8D8ZRX6_9HEMI
MGGRGRGHDRGECEGRGREIRRVDRNTDDKILVIIMMKIIPFIFILPSPLTRWQSRASIPHNLGGAGLNPRRGRYVILNSKSMTTYNAYCWKMQMFKGHP